MDILRADATYDPTSLVAGAHEAHIRALRLRGRRSKQSTPSTYVSGRPVSPVGATGVEAFLSADPWSRRVSTVVVDADEYQSLLEQVQQLHRLSVEVTRLSERLDRTERVRAD
jgi:hypothetical protein